MSTVVLMWNPAISGFKIEEFRDCIKSMRNHDEDEMSFITDEDVFQDDSLPINWSIWDYKNVHYGDRFFMVRVGEGQTGIVMAGTITSEPYKGKDWSGNGRKVYYSDLFCDCIVDTEVAPHISTEQLMEAMPEFDWTGGHSGRVLSDALAAKLEKLWAEYYYKYFGIFDNKRACRKFPPSRMPDALVDYLEKNRDMTCEICGYNFDKVWGMKSYYKNTFVRYIPRRTDIRCKNGDTVWKHIHCVCPNCSKMTYEDLAKKLGEEFYYPDGTYEGVF